MRLATGLAVAIGMLWAAPTATMAQDVNKTDLVKQLKPNLGLSRSIGAPKPMAEEDAEFVDGLAGLTRQIYVEEREKLAEVMEKTELPQVDLTIEFEFDSDALTPQATVTLATLGAALASDELEGSVFVLAGHTDSKGADDYNLDLSQRRAEAVKAFLLAAFKGKLAYEALIPVGFGEQQPANEYDPEAPENRRVTIVNVAQ